MEGENKEEVKEEGANEDGAQSVGQPAGRATPPVLGLRPIQVSFILKNPNTAYFL